MEELRARVVSFIQMEKMVRFKEKVYGESSKKLMDWEAKIEGRHNRGKSRKDKPPQSKFSHYTLLTERWSRVLKEACNAELIQLPAKNWPPPGVNKSKYYRYHQVVDHNTEECTTLKAKMENWSRRGSCRDSLRIKNLHGSKKGSVIKVDSVVGLEKQYNRNHDETSPPETQIQGVINMIAGGFTSGGSSKSASKCYVRSLKFVN